MVVTWVADSTEICEITDGEEGFEIEGDTMEDDWVGDWTDEAEAPTSGEAAEPITRLAKKKINNAMKMNLKRERPSC